MALRRDILSGMVAAGDRLPPEPELSERFGVSRLTVREAVKGLVAQRLIRIERGVGTHVLDYRRSGGLELVPHILDAERRRAGAAEGLSRAARRILTDALELRRILSAELLGLAALRIDGAQLDQLREVRRQQEQRWDDDGAFAAGDLRFISVIIDACANLALRLLFNTLHRTIEEISAVVPPPRELRAQSLELYDQVIACLDTGNGPAAREAVVEGLRMQDLYLQHVLEASSAPPLGPGRSADLPGDPQ